MYRKNTGSQFICVQLLLTATGAVATGLSPAARRCIDGTFAAATGTFTEDGTTGSYKFALSQADTNGNDISIIVTATGAMPVCVNFVTTACDPTTATNFGITALPATAATTNASLLTSGTGTDQLSVSSGLVKLQAVTHTGAVIPTVTTVTNQLTAAQIATGVWTDTTAADFTTALSIGKSVMNGVSLGTGMTIASVSGAVGSVTGAVGSVTGLTASNLDATISSRMATYTQPTGFLAATFPSGTIANTTNITSITGNITGNLSGSVGSVTAGVTVTTNSDKTGYSLTQTFPSNFSATAISAAGIVSSYKKTVNAVTVNGDGAGTPWGP